MTAFRGREAIISFFKDVDSRLNERVTVYLVGGSAMTAHGLKDQTKDIDLVLGVASEFERIRDGLFDMGFVVEDEPTSGFDDVGRTLELSGDTGVQVDLFEQQIVGKLRLSAPMCGRADQIHAGDAIHGFTLSTADMFLLKGVAGRGYDPDDMLALIRSGLNFEVVLEELETQLPVNTGAIEAHQLYTYSHPLMTFEQTITRFDGLPSTFTERVETLADRAFVEQAVLESLEDGSLRTEALCRKIAEADEAIDDSDTVLDAIARLDAKNVVERDADTVSIVDHISLP